MGKGTSIGIVSILLLILVPVSAAPQSEYLTENHENIGKEVSIIFEHDITYLDWLELENEGFIPLRQISKNEMLVWMSVSKTDSGMFNLEKLKNLNENLIVNVEQLHLTKYRVLLEPHLPSEGVVQVLNNLNNLNLKIISFPEIKDVGGVPASFQISGVLPEGIEINGIWKIEEILETNARNDVAASIIEGGNIEEHKLWSRGINGEGVLIAVADTGIDLDHACFRENLTEVGIPWGNSQKS